MRKYASYISMMLIAGVVSCLTSCLSDDDIEATPQCYITAFSVANITTTLVTPASDGSDSTYTRTISGSTIKFSIDQVNGKICSVDSLPSWVDLTRVVPTITHGGNIYAKLNADDKYYSVTSGSDSIDLSTPMDFLVMASDGVSFRHYTVVIYKASASADSLLWTELDNNLKITEGQKMVVCNGHLHVFGICNGKTMTSTSENGIQWTDPTPLQTTSDSIDCSSVLAYKERLYATDGNGKLYCSTDGITWTLATDKQVKTLLACDPTYLYAYDGRDIIATTDLVNWSVNSRGNLDMLPQTDISYTSYTTHTNDALTACVMTGRTENNADNAVVWYKVSSDDEESNQTWDYITVTEENTHPLPAMEGLNMFHYNDALYAVGGTNSVFYKSVDNGITWRKVEQYQFPPTALIANKHIATAVDGNNIYMIQTGENGSVRVWRGCLNKLQ